jgi:phosphodiesterase/alkaline phosphatase D-like protein
VTSSSFTANWTGVSGATGYRLDVSTNSSFSTYVSGYQNLNVGNVTSYNVTGLGANTFYYYRVRAYNGTSTSANSNVIRVKTKTH